MKYLRTLFSGFGEDFQRPCYQLFALLPFLETCEDVYKFSFNIILTKYDGLESGIILTQCIHVVHRLVSERKAKMRRYAFGGIFQWWYI